MELFGIAKGKAGHRPGGRAARPGGARPGRARSTRPAGSPAASGSGWRSPGPWPPSPTCWSATRSPRRSTSRCRARSSRCWRPCGRPARISMLFVTHNLALVRSIAARVQILNAGQRGRVRLRRRGAWTRPRRTTPSGCSPAQPAVELMARATLAFVEPVIDPQHARGRTPRVVGRPTRARCRRAGHRASSVGSSPEPAEFARRLDGDDGTSLVVLRRRACSCTSGTPTGSARDDLFLGASMTKSVLAHLVGARAAARWTSTTPSTATCPSWPAPATPACTVRDVLTHDQRRRLGRGPPRPGRPGHRARRLLRRGRLVARAAGPGRPAVPARHPLGVLHGRLPGARLGARTGHRRRLPPTRSASCGARLGCTADALVAVDGDGVAWPAAGSPPRPATGPGSACSQIDGSTPASGARPDGELPAVAAVPAARPPPARSPRTPASATTGGRWTTPGTRVTADGSRGQFVYVDRPRRTVVVKTSHGPTTTPPTTAQLPRPDLPHAPRASPPPPLHGKGSSGEPQGHHHLRADRRRRHGRPSPSTCR